MINSIEQYLSELKKELAGSDRATIQDALSDAEEYLRTALDGALNDKARISEAEALSPIIERYGLPAEVAAAYKEIEARTPPAFGRTANKVLTPAVPKPPVSPTPPLPPALPAVKDTRPSFIRFFSVFTDPRAWGSFFYLIFAMATGIIYFTWVVTGFSVSVGLLVLIIGIPIFALFLLSVRGIALMEGRLLEALVGVRMPRRPMFSRKDVSFWQKTKSLFADRLTWTALVYLAFQMPLGIIYFTVTVTLIGTGIWLIFWPIIAASSGMPTFVSSFYEYYMSPWLIPVWIICGGLLITATMHLVKFAARLHGNWAKVMLVRE